MRLCRTTRPLTMLLLIGAWLIVAACSESARAGFLLCQPSHSPCCPQSSSDHAESCISCQPTVDAVLQKNVLQKNHDQPQGDLVRTLVWWPQQPHAYSRHELLQGLRFQPSVFDLKADLRI